MMYDELIKNLRICSRCDFGQDCNGCTQDRDDRFCCDILLHNAADAIEDLENRLNLWRQDKIRRPKWIMFESRPMDEEERQYYSEHYGYELADDEAVIYCSQLPDHDQEVLVCNKYGHIWIDRFDDDPDYGVGFETNGDMDGLVAWMPLPQPPEREG